MPFKWPHLGSSDVVQGDVLQYVIFNIQEQDNNHKKGGDSVTYQFLTLSF